MSRIPHLDNPDFVLIDLDPLDCTFDLIVDAALLVKGVLDKIGLAGYPKTTGGDGLHIYIPVEPIYSYDKCAPVLDNLAKAIVTASKIG